MSGFMKTMLKTESSGFFLIAYFFFLISFFAFAVTAACNYSYMYVA